jgi:hypothetical protein
VESSILIQKERKISAKVLMCDGIWAGGKERKKERSIVLTSINSRKGHNKRQLDKIMNGQNDRQMDSQINIDRWTVRQT